MTTRTFDYCILRFCPSDVRAESVNVGLVVFKDDSLDIRMLRNATKVRALVHGLEDDLLPGAKAEIAKWASGSKSTAARYGAIKSLSYFNCSPLGNFSAQSPIEYRHKVKELFDEWVEPLSSLPQPTDKNEQLFFKIRRQFDGMKILSSDASDIDFGLIFPRYPLDLENRIFAEYTYKNGTQWNVIETLNFSMPADRLKRAIAYKAFVFDYAKQLFGENVRNHLLYEDEDKQHAESPLIKIAGRHADQLINLNSQKDTYAFLSKVQREASPNLSLALH